MDDEEEIVGAISLILGSIANKDLKSNMLAQLLSSSFKSIAKLVRFLSSVLHSSFCHPLSFRSYFSFCSLAL